MPPEVDPNDRGALDPDASAFDEAFTEAGGAAGAETEVIPPVAEDLGDMIPPEEPPADAAPPAGEAPPQDAPPAEEPATIPEQTVDTETDKARWLTLQGIYKKDKETWEQKNKELEEKLRLASEAKQPDVVTPPPADADPYAGLSDEEREALQEYDDEFDTVSKMESLKRKVELDKLRSDFTSEFAKTQDLVKQLLEAVAPQQALLAKSAEDAHFAEITKEHEDFFTHRDSGELRSWVDSLPGDLKEAYDKVYREGTADSIIRMVTQFKLENGIPVKNNSTPPPPPPNPNRENKRENLTVISGRKTAVNTATKSSDDFEGAFDEALTRS